MATGCIDTSRSLRNRLLFRFETTSQYTRAMQTKDKRWSQRVTRTSDALDLEAGVFALKDPRLIAETLKRSADASQRRKTDPFRSAMSMLSFYINRAGSQLPKAQHARLEQAKDELRDLYGRPRQMPKAAKRTGKRTATKRGA